MTKLNLGFQPRSKTLRRVLANAYLAGTDVDDVIVHHFTDTPQGLQLELEIRIRDEDALGGHRCEFNRIVLE